MSETKPKYKRPSKVYKSHVTGRFFYKLYKRDYENTKYTNGQFTNFIKDYYEQIRNIIINDAYTYEMFHRIGKIRILKYIPYYIRQPFNQDGTVNTSGMSVDWVKTKKAWKDNPLTKKKGIYIYYENKHSDGYKYYVYWNKSKMNFTNNKLYSFEECRTFRTLMGQAILKGSDYLTK